MTTAISNRPCSLVQLQSRNPGFRGRLPDDYNHRTPGGRSLRFSEVQLIGDGNPELFLKQAKQVDQWRILGEEFRKMKGLSVARDALGALVRSDISPCSLKENLQETTGKLEALGLGIVDLPDTGKAIVSGEALETLRPFLSRELRIVDWDAEQVSAQAWVFTSNELEAIVGMIWKSRDPLFLPILRRLIDNFDNSFRGAVGEIRNAENPYYRFIYMNDPRWERYKDLKTYSLPTNHINRVSGFKWHMIEILDSMR